MNERFGFDLIAKVLVCLVALASTARAVLVFHDPDDFTPLDSMVASIRAAKFLSTPTR
jgi:hypothetical protein